MRIALVASVLLIAFGLIEPASTRAAIVTNYAPTGSESVIPGVSHEWGTSQTDTATQHINVLRVAHDAADVGFDLGLPLGVANGRQRTTNQALAATSGGHTVVGAVNGDFWQTQKAPFNVTAPAGLNIRDGELVAGNTAGDRGALGFDAAGVATVATPLLTVSVTLPGDVTVAAAGVNRVRQSDQLIVYTPRFGSSTGTDSNGVEVVLTGAPLPMTTHGTYATTVAQVLTGTGNRAIGSGQVVLSATGTAGEALSGLVAGNAVTITTTIDGGWDDIVTAVGGTLLFTPDRTPDFSDPRYTEANPRTAAGVTADGDVLLLTVDGRSETSGGMAVTDLIDVLRSLGAVQGINLDGGGSTTMVVDPAGEAPLAVVNNPSQTYERRVSTSLQVVSTAEDALPTVTAPEANIITGVSAGKADAAVQLSWTPAHPESVASTELQRLGGDGLWHDVTLGDPQATSIDVRFKYSKHSQYRVRITDDDAKTSDWATSPNYVLNRFNESSRDIVRAGKWKAPAKSTAIGGHLAHSVYDGKAHILSLDLDDAQVAVVAQLSKSAGVAQITIGAAAALVDTHASSTRPRAVIFVGSGESISVANAASNAHPFVDIDAFLVLTTQ